LAEAGFSVLTWSQARPVGSVSTAVDELKLVMEEVRVLFPRQPVHLIAHSRGGLIARNYLLNHGCGSVRGLVTLGTPHHGTRMASIGKQLGAAAPVLRAVLPEDSQNVLTKALQRAAEFFESPALAELMPDSDFIRSMSSDLPSSIQSLTFGGTDPALLTLYVRTRNAQHWIPVRLPGFVFKSVPRNHTPPEVQPGLGDGLVSDASARLSGEGRHISLSLNHVALAFDPGVHEEILSFLASSEGLHPLP